MVLTEVANLRQSLAFALAVSNCWGNQGFFNLISKARFFIKYANFFFFFQTKLFQKFFKLLSKIVMAYLCHCSFRPRNTSGENITGKNPVRLFSSFCVQSNFRFSPLFCSVKNPFNFYFFTCLISLRYRESLSCKGNRFSYLLIFVGRKSLSLLRFISFMVKRHEPFKKCLCGSLP